MTGTDPGLRILIVGGRILPFRHAGDKNFWLDVIHELMARGHDVRVMSVTREPVTVPTPYPCEFVRPIPVYLSGTGRFNHEYRWLRGTNNYPSKMLSFGRVLRALRRHILADRPDVIHFSSNFGPVMAFLKPYALGVPISISAPTYNGGTLFYDPALRTSFHGFDTVVPFSDAFARRLGVMGLSNTEIRTIRWGVKVDQFRPPTADERANARRELGILGEEKVGFWAGFLQQMVAADFEFAMRVAKQLVRESPGEWRFFFCFKPEHFSPHYARYDRSGITVGGSGDLFRRAQCAADVMISPIADMRSTAAPPLTWIETMAQGVPLLTTPIPGADEVVSDGVSGLLSRNPEEAARRVADFFRSPERVAEARLRARQQVEERFDLMHSVTEYVRLWSEMATRPRAS
ncbi:MAG: glycosyltransferase family 4 protein [Thermoplasmata archaeon]